MSIEEDWKRLKRSAERLLNRTIVLANEAVEEALDEIKKAGRSGEDAKSGSSNSSSDIGVASRSRCSSSSNSGNSSNVVVVDGSTEWKSSGAVLSAKYPFCRRMQYGASAATFGLGVAAVFTKNGVQHLPRWGRWLTRCSGLAAVWLSASSLNCKSPFHVSRWQR